MYAVAQELDFNEQLWDTSKVVFKDTSGANQDTLFFLCAFGKAHILMANRKNWKPEAPQAWVCWVCGRNRADCLANFGLESTIDGWWGTVSPIGTIYRHIPADHCIPGYVLHGVVCVTIWGISGMRDVVSAATGKSAVVVVCNSF